MYLNIIKVWRHSCRSRGSTLHFGLGPEKPTKTSGKPTDAPRALLHSLRVIAPLGANKSAQINVSRVIYTDFLLFGLISESLHGGRLGFSLAIGRRFGLNSTLRRGNWESDYCRSRLRIRIRHGKNSWEVFNLFGGSSLHFGLGLEKLSNTSRKPTNAPRGLLLSSLSIIDLLRMNKSA